MPREAGYVIDGHEWMMRRFDIASDMYGLTQSQLPEFHEFMMSNATAWQISSRYFGMHPIPPTIEYPSRRKKIKQIAKELGTTGHNLSKTNVYMQGLWQKRHPEYSAKPVASYLKYDATSLFLERYPHRQGEIDALKKISGEYRQKAKGILPTEDTIKIPDKKSEDPETAEMRDSDLLDKYRFPGSIFQVEGRMKKDNVAERKWFIQKVKDWERVLSDSRASVLCRNLLLKELDLERLRMKAFTISVDNEDYKSISKLISDKEEEYERQWQALNDAYPLAGVIAQKARVTGVMSDYVKAYQEYVSNANNALIDGIFTYLEIQVLCRQSKQAPLPQYRYGWSVAKQLAKKGIWYSDYSPNPRMSNDNLETTNHTLKGYNGHAFFALLDKNFRKAIEKTRQDLGLELVDLEDDDTSNGEYKKLAPLPNEPAIKTFGVEEMERLDERTEKVKIREIGSISEALEKSTEDEAETETEEVQVTIQATPVIEEEQTGEDAADVPTQQACLDADNVSASLDEADGDISSYHS